MWNERIIVTALCRQVFRRKCLLLLKNCLWTGAECDVLGVTNDLRIIDVEVKISRADLKVDAKKDKWWTKYWPWDQRDQHLCMPEPRRWPRLVWKHYYAMPEDVWKDDLLNAMPSTASGVILLRSAEPPQPIAIARIARHAKPAKDAYRLKPEQVIDIARLANIRMWDAYEQLARMKGEIELEAA